MVQRPPVATHLRLLPAVPEAAAAAAAADALPFSVDDEPFEDALEAALATELALPVPEAELFSFFFFPEFFRVMTLLGSASTPPPPPVDEAGEDAPESK